MLAPPTDELLDVLHEVAERFPDFPGIGAMVREDGLLRLSGTLDDSSAVIAFSFPSVEAPERGLQTLIEVRSHLGAPDWLEVHRLSPDLSEHPDRVRTGDPYFDKRFAVLGPQDQVLGLLDRSLRGLLTSSSLTSFADGVASIVSDGIRSDIDKIQSQLQHLADLVAWLATVPAATPLPSQLLLNAITDRVSRVRLHNAEVLIREHGETEEAQSSLEGLLEMIKNDADEVVRRRLLELLVDHLPESESTRAALEAATQDADADTRLYAGGRLGAEGLECLRKLSSSRFVVDRIRLDAIAQLESVLDEDELADLMTVCAQDPSDRIRRRALRSVVAIGGPALGDRVRRMVRHIGAKAAEDLIEILEGVEVTMAEPGLIELLEHSNGEVRRRAVQALGRIGTIESVGPLLRLAQAVFIDGQIKEGARMAILRIQSRLETGSAGALSISEIAEAGGLDFAEAESGSLTMSERPEEPLEAPHSPGEDPV